MKVLNLKNCFSLLFFYFISFNSYAEENVRINIQTGHSNDITDIRFSNDGSVFASSSLDKTVKVFDTLTGNEIITLSGNIRNPEEIFFSKDNKKLNYLTSDKKLKTYQINNWNLLKDYQLAADENSPVSFSNSQYYIAYQKQKYIIIYDTNLNKETKKILNTEKITSIAFANENTLITGDSKGQIKVYDIKSSKLLKSIKAHNSSIRKIITADKNFLTIGNDKLVKQWDLKTFKNFYKYTSDIKDIASVNNDSFIELENNLFKIRNIKDLKTLKTIPSQSQNIKNFDLKNNLIVYSENENIYVYNTDNKNIAYKIENKLEKINSTSLKGKYLAFGTDNSARIWDLSKNQQTILANNETITAIEFNPDTELIATGNNKGNLKLWQLPAKNIFINSNTHQGAINSIVFNAESIYFASASSDSKLKIWRVGSGQELVTLEAHTAKINSVDYHPDNERIISGSSDNTVKLWDTIDSKYLRNLKFSSEINSVKFNPKGDMFAVASGDNLKEHKNMFSLSLWDINSFNKLKDLKGHKAKVSVIAFNYDGSIMASGSDDNSIKLWNVLTGENFLTMNGHSNQISYLSFLSKSKNKILSSSSDNSFIIWNLADGKEAARLFSFRDGNYLVVTPDNYFCGSNDINKYISFYKDNTLADFQTNFEKYNNCDIALKSAGF